MLNESQNPEELKKQTQQPSKPKTKIKDFDILPALVGFFAIFIICLSVYQYIRSTFNIEALLALIAFGLCPVILLTVHRRRIKKKLITSHLSRPD